MGHVTLPLLPLRTCSESVYRSFCSQGSVEFSLENMLDGGLECMVEVSKMSRSLTELVRRT